jgi:hypothetical protein
VLTTLSVKAPHLIQRHLPVLPITCINIEIIEGRPNTVAVELVVVVNVTVVAIEVEGIGSIVLRYKPKRAYAVATTQ